jgi:hypothetical protein
VCLDEDDFAAGLADAEEERAFAGEFRNDALRRQAPNMGLWCFQ